MFVSETPEGIIQELMHDVDDGIKKANQLMALALIEMKAVTKAQEEIRAIQHKQRHTRRTVYA